MSFLHYESFRERDVVAFSVGPGKDQVARTDMVDIAFIDSSTPGRRGGRKPNVASVSRE